MPNAIKAYVRHVDATNRVVGRFAMYFIFVMMAILLYSSVSKTFFVDACSGPRFALSLHRFNLVPAPV